MVLPFSTQDINMRLRCVIELTGTNTYVATWTFKRREAARGLTLTASNTNPTTSNQMAQIRLRYNFTVINAEIDRAVGISSINHPPSVVAACSLSNGNAFHCNSRDWLHFSLGPCGEFSKWWRWPRSHTHKFISIQLTVQMIALVAVNGGLLSHEVAE